MRPTTTRTSAPLVEPLESRALLAADLAVLSASTTNLAANGNKTGALTIKNTGTVAMSGPVTVTFVATAIGKPNQTLGTATVTLANLKPNATKPVTGVKLSAPDNAGSSGTIFNIVARITPHTTPADTAAGNNSKAAGTVTLDSTSPGSAVSPFGIQGTGSKLKFKKTKSLPGNGAHGRIHESGTFSDDKGHTGTYSLDISPSGTQVLDLDFKTSGSFPGGSRRRALVHCRYSAPKPTLRGAASPSST